MIFFLISCAISLKIFLSPWCNFYNTLPHSAPPNRQLRKPKCDNLLCFFKNEWNVKFKIFLWLGNFTLPIIEIRNWRLQKRKQKKIHKKPQKNLKNLKYLIQESKQTKKICYCVCKYLSMLFLVISTKKRFQKSNCKRKDPEWVYGTRGQKKPNRQKKSPVLYNKTQQKNMWSILHVELRKKEISLTYFIPRFAYFMQHFVIIFCV